MQDASGCSFQELLKMLADTHDREIALLKGSLARARVEGLFNGGKDQTGRRSSKMMQSTLELSRTVDFAPTSSMKADDSIGLARSKTTTEELDDSIREGAASEKRGSVMRAKSDKRGDHEHRGSALGEMRGSFVRVESERRTSNLSLVPVFPKQVLKDSPDRRFSQSVASSMLQDYLKDSNARRTSNAFLPVPQDSKTVGPTRQPKFGSSESRDSVSPDPQIRRSASPGSQRTMNRSSHQFVPLPLFTNGGKALASPRASTSHVEAPAPVPELLEVAPSRPGRGRSPQRSREKSNSPPASCAQTASTNESSNDPAQQQSPAKSPSQLLLPPSQSAGLDGVNGAETGPEFSGRRAKSLLNAGHIHVNTSHEAPPLLDLDKLESQGKPDAPKAKQKMVTSESMDALRQQLQLASLKKPLSLSGVNSAATSAVNSRRCSIDHGQAQKVCETPDTSPKSSMIDGKRARPSPRQSLSLKHRELQQHNSHNRGIPGIPVRSVSCDAVCRDVGGLERVRSNDSIQNGPTPIGNSRGTSGQRSKSASCCEVVEESPLLEEGGGGSARASYMSTDSRLSRQSERRSGFRKPSILKKAPQRSSGRNVEEAECAKERSLFGSGLSRSTSQVSFEDDGADVCTEDSFGDCEGQPTTDGCDCFMIRETLQLEDEFNYGHGQGRPTTHWTSQCGGTLTQGLGSMDLQAQLSNRQSGLPGYSRASDSGPQSYARGSVFSVSSMEQATVKKRIIQLDSMIGHPNSAFNFQLDCLSLLLLAYDFVVIPAQVFDPEANLVSIAMTWFKALFWTMDLIRGFFLGYYSLGDVVLSGQVVAYRYVRTWLFPNLVFAILDWVFLVLFMVDADSGQFSWLPGLRVLILFRCTKAIHLIKMIEDRITSELASVFWKTNKFFTAILVLNHLAACSWYWIGISFKERHKTWVKEYLDNEAEFTFGYRYTTSFHWALTQFTPASIAVQPHNVYERVFAIIVLLFALVTTSTFVSGITGAVMQMASLKSAKSRQFWLLRRYLKETHVPTPLAARIHNFCDYAWDRQQAVVQEKNVQMLTLLSQQLSAELRTAIYEPVIAVHPFFILISKLAPLTVQALCNTAIAGLSFGRGDHLFSRGEACPSMYFIWDGDLVYDICDQEPSSLRKKNWLCEPSLWTTWFYIGTLRATTESNVIAISDDRFAIAIRSNVDIQFEVANYAKGFVAGLNRLPVWKLTDLYQSSMIEGLWFRLMHEHKCRSAGTATLTNIMYQQENNNKLKIFGVPVKQRLAQLLPSGWTSRTKPKPFLETTSLDGVTGIDSGHNSDSQVLN